MEEEEPDLFELKVKRIFCRDPLNELYYTCYVTGEDQGKEYEKKVGGLSSISIKGDVPFRFLRTIRVPGSIPYPDVIQFEVRFPPTSHVWCEVFDKELECERFTKMPEYSRKVRGLESRLSFLESTGASYEEIEKVEKEIEEAKKEAKRRKSGKKKVSLDID